MFHSFVCQSPFLEVTSTAECVTENWSLSVKILPNVVLNGSKIFAILIQSNIFIVYSSSILIR